MKNLSTVKIIEKASAAPGSEGRKLATYCYQCVAGPDLLTVKVNDQGVATEVEPNFAAESDGDVEAGQRVENGCLA